MSKRDDRVSLVDMLVHAEEAIALLGEASQDEWDTITYELPLLIEQLRAIVGKDQN